MKLLIDTHAFLWFISGNARLPAPARAMIADPANTIFVSIASLWEMAIKSGIGNRESGSWSWMKSSPGSSRAS